MRGGSHCIDFSRIKGGRGTNAAPSAEKKRTASACCCGKRTSKESTKSDGDEKTRDREREREIHRAPSVPHGGRDRSARSSTSACTHGTAETQVPNLTYTQYPCRGGARALGGRGLTKKKEMATSIGGSLAWVRVRFSRCCYSGTGRANGMARREWPNWMKQAYRHIRGARRCGTGCARERRQSGTRRGNTYL